MTLSEWVTFHGLQWIEFGALIDCSPSWAHRVVHGEPCSQALADRIHAVTGLWPYLGRGRNWRRGYNDGRLDRLQELIRAGCPREYIMDVMHYKNKASARAMISLVKRKARGCVTI